jgi:hypothetical protein
LGADAAGGAEAGLRLAAGLWVTTTGAVALALTVAARHWPLVHDGPILHYIAWRLLEGAAPYRDLFDMNLPGVYLVHMAGLTALGGGQAGFRALDLLLLAGAATGLLAMLAGAGALAGVAAAALFWLYHLAGGAWNAAQRDLMACAPLAWAAAAVLVHRRGGRPGFLGASALLVGVAACVKPHALLLAPVPLALAWRTGPGNRRVAIPVVGAALVVPLAATLAWVLARGGLPAFLDLAAGYLVPLYSRLGRDGFAAAMSLYGFGAPALPLLLAWAAAGTWVLWRPGPRDAHAATLAAGLAYGVVHFLAQGKGWEYHLYPLALFAAASGAAGLGTALAARRRGAAALLIGLGVLTTVALGVKGRQNLHAPWVAETLDRAETLARDLRPLAAAGGTVQVLDTTAGGVHALYLAGARQPTRFLYDFPFHHDVQHPYVQGLRRELLAGLAARPPTAVVLFEQGWPAGGYERLAAFPELERWLAAGYRVAREGPGYRLYRPRAAATG